MTVAQATAGCYGHAMKLIVFDCDGTLADSQHMIVTAMERAFAANGLIAPLRDHVLSVVGLSLANAIVRLVPEHNGSLIEKLAGDYKTAFHELRRSGELEEPLYSGVREALSELASRENVLLGIATGKSRRGIEALLAREGLLEIFYTVQTADTHPSKPHPSMLHAAMAAAGVAPEAAIMVGDTTYDMEMARAAGVDAIGVAWGYHPESLLTAAGARAVIRESTLLGHGLAPYLPEAEFLS
jgi:phosphoglycolate phosphatase